MADAVDNQAGEDVSGESGNGKKGRQGKSFIIKGLIYVIVFLVLLILMVITSYITNQILNSGNRDTQLAQVSNEFVFTNPIYTYYDQIPDLRTRTADESPRSLTVSIELGYDKEAFENLSEELTQRKPQLTDFFRKYFSSRTARELDSTNEDRVKEELKSMINELLRNGKVEEVVFTDLQVLDF